LKAWSGDRAATIWRVHPSAACCNVLPALSLSGTGECDRSSNSLRWRRSEEKTA